MHEVLVNRLGGLSLPRKSVVRLTDRPDMTLDVYCGRKTTNQKKNLETWKLGHFMDHNYLVSSKVADDNILYFCGNRPVSLLWYVSDPWNYNACTPKHWVNCLKTRSLWPKFVKTPSLVIAFDHISELPKAWGLQNSSRAYALQHQVMQN